MSQIIAIRTICKSCLEPRQLDDDGLCDSCSLWNQSLDGTLLALLEVDGETADDDR